LNYDNSVYIRVFGKF